MCRLVRKEQRLFDPVGLGWPLIVRRDGVYVPGLHGVSQMGRADNDNNPA